MPRSCGTAGCKKQPYWGIPGETPKFCFLHKSSEHIDVRNKRCEVISCETRPHYGYDGEAPRFCAQHRAEGMHNLRSRRCEHEGCPKYASCGAPGGTPEVCATHKAPGMVSLIGRRCSHSGCDTYASYGVVGTRPRYCSKHKEDDMVNLTVKKCETDGCLLQPNHNFNGQRKARFCANHALDGMIDVLERRCAQTGCDRQPIYGNSGEMVGRPTWCPHHRPDNSYDVKTARCQEPNCQKHPSYGYDNDRVRRRCRLHKLNDMVDVKSPRCEWPQCRKQPCCGHLGAKARYCSEHKQDGMVNLKTRAFRCKYRGSGTLEDGTPTGRNALCNRACRFAYPNEPAQFCQKHAAPGMVDVLNPQCGMDDCLELPTHGYDGEQPTFCMRHMAVGMKVIVPQKANIDHWSSEARKQAEATAREATRISSEREAGSAKVAPLPAKRDPTGLHRARAAHRHAARSALGAGIQSYELPLDTSGAPTAPSTSEESVHHSISAADVALAFGSQENVNIGDPTSPNTEASVFAGSSMASTAPSGSAPTASPSVPYALAAKMIPFVEPDTAGGAFAVGPRLPMRGSERSPAQGGEGAASGTNARAVGYGRSLPFPALPQPAATFVGRNVQASLPPEIPSPATSSVSAFPVPTGAVGVVVAPPAANASSGIAPPFIPNPRDSAPASAPSASDAPSGLAPPSSTAFVPGSVSAACSVPVAGSARAASSAPAASAVTITGASPAVRAAEVVAPAAPASGSATPATVDPLAIAPTAAGPEGIASTGNGSASSPPTKPSEGAQHPAIPVADAFAASGAPATTSSTEQVTKDTCGSPGCTGMALFGHPGAGKSPTRCLTHCEEGMHRLAEDTELRPAPVPAAQATVPFKPTAPAALLAAVGTTPSHMQESAPLQSPTAATMIPAKMQTTAQAQPIAVAHPGALIPTQARTTTQPPAAIQAPAQPRSCHPEQLSSSPATAQDEDSAGTLTQLKAFAPPPQAVSCDVPATSTSSTAAGSSSPAEPVVPAEPPSPQAPERSGDGVPEGGARRTRKRAEAAAAARSEASGSGARDVPESKRAKRTTRSSAGMKDGMMLLAGAVTAGRPRSSDREGSAAGRA